MLTQLSTLKTRLSLDPADPTYDTLLLRAIEAISARFDKETNRTLARTVALQQEFDADDTKILATCYPIESVTKFELKTSEREGWIEQPNLDHLIRQSCIISLPVNLQPATCNLQQPLARVTYTGGYLLPGSPRPDPPVAVCLDLPADLEQAAVKQVAFWFQKREKLGLKTYWPKGTTYEQFADLDLLQPVKEILKRHKRWHV